METTLAEQLRQMISNSGLTAYQLRATTGIEASVISRFINGERDIRLETAGKLATALGAELKLKSSRKKLDTHSN